MNAVLDGLLLFLFLVVGGWVAAFGTANALLARQRGKGAASGFALGVLFGPAAWGWTLWATRPNRVALSVRATQVRSSAESRFRRRPVEPPALEAGAGPGPDQGPWTPGS